MADRARSAITPTAHYTGHVWLRHGLSHPAMATAAGAAMFTALRPFDALLRSVGGPSLEALLIARHRVIDALLERAIESGRVGQVIELAAGLSPRGQRFAARFADRGLIYVESDLPDMVDRKRRLYAGAALERDNLHVEFIDALRDDGDHSLSAVADRLLVGGRGTAVITEGLIGYLGRDRTAGLWQRIARALDRPGGGVYLSDLNLEEHVRRLRGASAFRQALAWFTRRPRLQLFADVDDASAALSAAGFSSVDIHEAGSFPGLDVPGPRASGHVHVIEAWR